MDRSRCAIGIVMCRWNDATSPIWPSPKKRHRRNPSPAHAAAIGIAISIYKRLPKSGKQSKPPAIGGKIDAAACARTGKLSARPAGKPGDFFTAQESLRDRRRCVFEAGRNLSSDGAKNPEPATSGLPPTGAEPRYGSAPGETRSAHRPDEFRPAHPRSGLVATRARLRFTGTGRLPRPSHCGRANTTFLLCQATRHFYFALTDSKKMIDR